MGLARRTAAPFSPIRPTGSTLSDRPMEQSSFLKNVPSPEVPHQRLQTAPLFWAQGADAASRLVGAALVILPVAAAALWLVSLQGINLREMNDLGLVSILPPLFYISVLLLIGSFVLNLAQPRVALGPVLLQTVILILILYGTPMLIEPTPRIHVTWRHAGFSEYIIRRGSVAPTLESYFNWPGFFSLAAFLTEASGLQDPIELTTWASVFFNLIYLAPLVLIWRAAVPYAKQIWVAVWLFYVSNWLGQDHFAPQALNFFFYLLIVGILLYAFRVTNPRLQLSVPGGTSIAQRSVGFVNRLLAIPFAPGGLPPGPGQTIGRPARVGLLVVVLLVFTAMVTSHQLSPFFTLATVTCLVLLNLVSLRGLPLIMVGILATWISFMTVPFLAGHTDMLVGNVGRVDEIVSANLLGRLQGSPEHLFVVNSRIVLTGAFAVMALLGGLRRIRHGYWDLAMAVLAVVPFSLLVLQSYGGEMLLRAYLFALPGLVFFAAAMVLPDALVKFRWWTPLLVGVLLGTLAAGFFIARYGNERMDYFTEDEVAALDYVYQVAPRDALLATASPFAPYRNQDLEKYRYRALEGRLFYGDVNHIEELAHETAVYLQERRGPAAYLILTRSQQAHAELFNGLPPGAWERLENAFAASNEFEQVFANPDAQVFLLK